MQLGVLVELGGFLVKSALIKTLMMDSVYAERGHRRDTALRNKIGDLLGIHFFPLRFHIDMGFIW